MKKFFLYIIPYLLTILFIVFMFQKNAIDTKYRNTSFDFDIQLGEKDNFILSISFYIIKPIIEKYLDSRLNTDFIINYTKKKNFLNKNIGITDVNIGSGEGILCGQKGIFLMKNKNGKQEKIEIKLGKEIPLINIGLIGLKEHGTRIINYNKENIIATLVDIVDKYPKTTKDLKVFNNISVDKKAYMCGDKVNINYFIKNLKNNVLLEGSIAFNIGDNSVPIAMELGSLEIQKDNKRFVITPNNLLKVNPSMNNKIVANFSNKILNDEIYLLEINLV